MSAANLSPEFSRIALAIRTSHESCPHALMEPSRVTSKDSAVAGAALYRLSPGEDRLF